MALNGLKLILIELLINHGINMEFLIYFQLLFQIDRASAGNVKRTKDEIAADEEDEDDFGYTNSECFIFIIDCHF